MYIHSLLLHLMVKGNDMACKLREILTFVIIIIMALTSTLTKTWA